MELDVENPTTGELAMCGFDDKGTTLPFPAYILKIIQTFIVTHFCKKIIAHSMHISKNRITYFIFKKETPMVSDEYQTGCWLMLVNEKNAKHPNVYIKDNGKFIVALVADKIGMNRKDLGQHKPRLIYRFLDEEKKEEFDQIRNYFDTNIDDEFYSFKLNDPNPVLIRTQAGKFKILNGVRARGCICTGNTTHIVYMGFTRHLEESRLKPDNYERATAFIKANTRDRQLFKNINTKIYEVSKQIQYERESLMHKKKALEDSWDSPTSTGDDESDESEKSKEDTKSYVDSQLIPLKDGCRNHEHQLIIRKNHHGSCNSIKKSAILSFFFLWLQKTKKCPPKKDQRNDSEPAYFNDRGYRVMPLCKKNDAAHKKRTAQEEKSMDEQHGHLKRRERILVNTDVRYSIYWFDTRNCIFHKFTLPELEYGLNRIDNLFYTKSLGNNARICIIRCIIILGLEKSFVDDILKVNLDSLVNIICTKIEVFKRCFAESSNAKPVINIIMSYDTILLLICTLLFWKPDNLKYKPETLEIVEDNASSELETLLVYSKLAWLYMIGFDVSFLPDTGPPYFNKNQLQLQVLKRNLDDVGASRTTIKCRSHSDGKGVSELNTNVFKNADSYALYSICTHTGCAHFKHLLLLIKHKLHMAVFKKISFFSGSRPLHEPLHMFRDPNKYTIKNNKLRVSSLNVKGKLECKVTPLNPRLQNLLETLARLLNSPVQSPEVLRVYNSESALLVLENGVEQVSSIDDSYDSSIDNSESTLLFLENGVEPVASIDA